MSKRRVLLIVGLVILIAFAIVFFIYSKINTNTPSAQSTDERTRKTTLTTEETKKETPKDELEALPADNTEAIESELNNIDKEINSAIDVDLEDLSDIENSL